MNNNYPPSSYGTRALQRLVFLALTTSLVMTGCAQQPTVSSNTSTNTVQGRLVLPDDPARPEETNTPTRIGQPVGKPVRNQGTPPSPAAQQLLARADAAQQAGNYDQALLLLDRAQRISPQAAEVYFHMAKVNYAQGTYPQAEQLCLKALAFTGEGHALRGGIYQLLANVRSAMGDEEGARKAREKAALRG